MSASAPVRDIGGSAAKHPSDWRWLVPVAPWLWFLVRSVHRALDYVAIGLPVLIGVGLVATTAWLVVRPSLAALATVASLGLFFVAAVIAPMRPASSAEPGETIRVATMNLGLYWFSDNDAGFFVFDEEPDVVIGAELAESHHLELSQRFAYHEADIISLEEQQANQEALTPVGSGFRRNGLPSIGIYSNLPMTVLDDPIGDRIDGGLPGFRVRVETPSGPVVVYALHVPRPFPGDGAYELSASDHGQLVDAIVDAIELETEPVIVAGDLNAVDRGRSYRRFTSSLNDALRHGGWAVPTGDRDLPWPVLLARLDHILISRELCTAEARSLDARYADHRHLIADVGRCAT